MVVPALLVGVQAIRTNALVRGTLESLGERLARSRTYAEVEDAMFNQTQVIWRYLSGDPAAKKEFPLTEQVVAFWLDRWTAELPPDELKLADGVRRIEADIRTVAGRVFTLHDAGRHDAAAVLARRELVERLQPALADVNREIYRRAREFSVQAAVAQVAGIVDRRRRRLWGISALARLRAAAQLAQPRVEGPPAAAREQLSAIIEQVDRLDLRIAHLLTFSRPAPLRPLRESVRTLVDGALSGFAELLRRRRVELAV